LAISEQKWENSFLYGPFLKPIRINVKSMLEILHPMVIFNMDLTFILIGFKKGPYKKLFSHFCSEIAKSRRVLPGKLTQKVATNGPAL
jgi:hypothetical protein